ncbi:MAG: hypothetical protein ACREML_03215 [Vulcanimicrobiaceae bacterium]
MTGAQKLWLDAHKREGWQTTGVNQSFARRGMLHADGSFDPINRMSRPKVTPGCFEVGLLAKDNGSMERR